MKVSYSIISHPVEVTFKSHLSAERNIQTVEPISDRVVPLDSIRLLVEDGKGVHDVGAE